MVFSQDGIFHRAEQAADKHGEAKARETLELALGEAQMQKYEEGLTDEQLTEKINAIGEELPKEKPENPNLQNVIVDGHIFEIDRSVPKIVDYIGPADGVIITAQITQNGDWKNPVATVTGTITKYGGGTVTSSSAIVISGNANITDFPTNGGNYTIENITEDTEIKITAIDSNGESSEKKINVRPRRDTTGPTISDATVTLVAEDNWIKMKIKISAKVTDSESGLQSFVYNITGPGTVTPASGTALTSGVEKEITTDTPGEYTVTFTATDKVGNTTTTPGIKVTTSNAITIADLKANINASNYPDYIGIKVNYKPDDTAAWRVFYYDAGDAEHPNGYFGDGAGTIYLKRDPDTNTQFNNNNRSHNPADDGALMRQLNPDWASRDGTIDLVNEHCAAWLCDSSEWETYKTADAKYAIGAAPVEMWTKAHSAYKNKYEPSNSTIGCGIKSENGYGYTINNGDLVNYQNTTVVNTSVEQSKVIAIERRQWLASPSTENNNSVCYMSSNTVNRDDIRYYNDSYDLSPVVSLNH